MDKQTTHQNPTISQSVFGNLNDAIVKEFTLSNKDGIEVHIIEYGATINKIITPDKNGNRKDIVLGFNTLESYLNEHPYFGATVGRYGNRIANGKFLLDGVNYSLAQNNGKNSLHGGIKGFDKQLWKGTILEDQSGVSFEYISTDMEEGFPGNLSVKVVYKLTVDNELKIKYSATTDRATVVNLTNHSYFNLNGEGNRDVLNHELILHADTFTPVDESLIPTGEIRLVAGTPFDFTNPYLMGERIDVTTNQQIQYGGGYDHNYVLTEKSTALKKAAIVTEKNTGRVLEVFSTEPAVQLYTGNFLDGTLIGKSGGAYGKRSGFCLETQHYPDSPNQKAFPSTRLDPGEEYASETIFKFSHL